MENFIQLIWDFFGPDAEKTAQHQVLHLKTYATVHGFNVQLIVDYKITDTHYTATMVVDKDRLMMVRDGLKPHRAKVYTTFENN